MATYLELISAQADANLTAKVKIATIIAADGVRTESNNTANHYRRLQWAREALRDPVTAGNEMLWAILAQNSAVPLAAILAASDASIQTAVNNAVDLLAGV